MPLITGMLGLALTLAMLVASCGTDSKDDGEVATDGSTTTEATATSTTTPATTTTSAPTTATTATTAVDATDDPRCGDPGAQTGDVDGDGTDDRVVHVFSETEAVLRLCASSVGYQELPGLGQAQHLDLADIEQDGRVEVFYGATTAGSLGAQIAVVHDGALTVVTEVGGDPFVVHDGYPEGFEGPRHDFGCAAAPEGGRALFTKVYEIPNGLVTTSQIAIDGTTATVVATDAAQAELAGSPTRPTGDLIDPC